MKYELSFARDRDPIPGVQPCATPDFAIYNAKALVSIHNRAIFVLRIGEMGVVEACGYADWKGWHWLVRCPRCKGSGECMLRVKGTATPSPQPCTCCRGQKTVDRESIGG